MRQESIALTKENDDSATSAASTSVRGTLLHEKVADHDMSDDSATSVASTRVRPEWTRFPKQPYPTSTAPMKYPWLTFGMGHVNPAAMVIQRIVRDFLVRRGPIPSVAMQVWHLLFAMFSSSFKGGG